MNVLRRDPDRRALVRSYAESAGCGFDSHPAHHFFNSTLRRRQVVEKWRRYSGSIESISVERDSFRKEQLLEALLVVERSLNPQV
jgi:hypothetical protein